VHSLLKKDKLVLIGAGGHARSVIDSIDRNGYEEIVLLDKAFEPGFTIDGIPVIGDDDKLKDLFEKGFNKAFISVGSIGAKKIRKDIYERVKEIGYTFPQVIDSSAVISHNTVRLAEGIFIGKGAIINVGADIGECAIINSGAIIDHDCTIGAFVHIAPGVCISGGVKVGDCTHIGTGSSIIQNIKIGCNSVIGAGSMVNIDVDDGVTAFGVPCKVQEV